MAIDAEESRGTEPSPSRRFPPFCVGCGYNLSGAVSPRCPECGRFFIAREWHEEVARLTQQAREIKDIDGWLRAGLIVGVAGLTLLGLSIVSQGSCIGPVFRGLGGVGGGTAFFLGMGVFRAKRMPQWARDLLAVRPDYAKGIVAMLLGAGAVALSLFGRW